MVALVALANTEVSAIFKFALESQLGLTVITTTNSVDTIRTLLAQKNISLLIAEGTEDPNSIIHHVNNKKIKVPTILCVFNEENKTGTFGLRNILGVVHGKAIVDDLIALLKPLVEAEKAKGGFFQKKNEPMAESKTEDASPPKTADDKNQSYCRVNTSLLLRVSPLKANVFLRLSSQKFIKLFQEGDVFDKTDYNKYLLQKKIDYFYLVENETKEFLDKLKNDILNFIAKATKEEIEKFSEVVSENVHETVADIIKTMGVTEEVQQLVKANMQLTLKVISKSPKFSMIIDRIKAEPTKYISSHSTMIGELSCALATAAGWHSDATFYKLNLAAFLHDITMQNQQLATIQTMKEFFKRADEFTPEEQKQYKEHPFAAAQIVKQFSEIPPDVDTIIAQHHELPDGKGFPRGLNHQVISPLGATFKAAHDLVLFIIKHPDTWNFPDFIAEVEPLYSTGGSFKRILKALADMNDK